MKNPTRSGLLNKAPVSISSNDFCYGVETEENLPGAHSGIFYGPQSII